MDAEDRPPTPEPALNVPSIVLAIGALLLGIHAIVFELLAVEQQGRFLATFAFTDPGAWQRQGVEVGSRLWTVFTHAFLHADWTHLGVNMLWFVAFGSAVARRFGTLRFLLFFLASSAAGAAAHWIAHPDSPALLVGASGAVAGCFGAATRFAMTGGFRFGLRDDVPALTLGETFSNPTALAFIGMYLVLNVVFGSGFVPVAGQDVAIAWEAHVGGFAFGLLGFSLLDPVGSRAV